MVISMDFNEYFCSKFICHCLCRLLPLSLMRLLIFPLHLLCLLFVSDNSTAHMTFLTPDIPNIDNLNGDDDDDVDDGNEKEKDEKCGNINFFSSEYKNDVECRIECKMKK